MHNTVQAWRKLDSDKVIRKLLDEHLKGGQDNAAYELMLGLLRANPKNRFSINDVTASTFLTGGAALNTILGETKVWCLEQASLQSGSFQPLVSSCCGCYCL